jgi:uncharacterized protein
VIVVSDASPITNLAAIGQLDLLRQLYQRVVIPDAVYRELTTAGGVYPGAVAQSLNWIETQPVSNRVLVIALRAELDEGEAEAIALAQALPADLVLIDEHFGRAVANRFGLRVIGILGVLIEAKNRDMIPEVKPLVDRLINNGFRIGQDLYARVLQAAGE